MKRTVISVFRSLPSGRWLLPALLLAAGCQHSGPYAPQADRHPGVSEAGASVVLMDAAVQASITSAGDRGVPQPDGRLLAQANLKNRESRRVQVQVQCVFKDEQGFATGDETPWITLILAENATEAVEFKSMNTLARKYTIRVKQAR
jgi:uncharacterized protein YcfL